MVSHQEIIEHKKNQYIGIFRWHRYENGISSQENLKDAWIHVSPRRFTEGIPL